jgi:hypothetical protein
MFLTVPTVGPHKHLRVKDTDMMQELSVWRKQANLSVQEEFADKPLPQDLEDSLPKTLPELFDTVRSGVRRSSESYINLCNMMERLTRRNEGMAAEYHRFSAALASLTESSQETYAVDTNDVPLLNEGLNSTARHLDQSKQLLEDEARAWDQGVLEDFKRQRDTLVSVRDMFDRRDKYAKDNKQRNEATKYQEQATRSDQAWRKRKGRRRHSQGKLHLFIGERKRSAANAMSTGQRINCATTCPRSIHQGMHPRRTAVFPKEPVSYQQTTPGMEPRAREVCRATSRQLASAERGSGEHAVYRLITHV